MMRASGLALLVLGLGLGLGPACQLAFELAPVPQDGAVDAAPDAPPGPNAVTGRLVRQAVINDASHVPVTLDSPFDPALTAVLARFEDGTTVTVALASDGTFSFERPVGIQRYRLSYLDGANLREVQHDAARLDIVERSLGRESPRATAPTTVDFVSTAVEGAGWIVSTGIWTQTQTTDAALDWLNAKAIAGTPGLLDASEFDAVYFLDFATSAGYRAIARKIEAAVTMINGQLTMVTTPPSTVARDDCARIVAPTTTIRTRFGTAIPQYPILGLTTHWSVIAQAHITATPLQNLQLTYSDNPVTANVDLDVYFHQPFPGHRAMAAFTALATRPIQRGGNFTSLGGHGRVFVPIPAGTCPRVEIPDLVTYPVNPKLRGVPLVADTMVLSIGTDPVTLEWTRDGVAPSFYIATLFSGTDTGPLSFTSVRRVTTIEPRAVFDASLFTAGGYYIFQLQAVTGYPNAANGDFETVGYPYAWSLVQSSMFQAAL